MLILVELGLTEDEFARLEARVEDIRVWLDAGRGTREGQGEKFIGKVEGLNLSLEVRRDDA